MNQVSGTQKILLTISTTLIVLVAYLSTTPEQQQNQDTLLLSELMNMEYRLQQQIENLKKVKANSTNSQGDYDNFKELNRLNQQLSSLIAQQSINEKRFAKLEERLSQLASQTGEVQLASNRDISVLSSIPVEFKSERQKQTDVEKQYEDQYSVNQLLVIQKQIDVYDQQLMEETPDPEWSNTIETHVIKVINETPELSGVHLQESQCGASLCKLQVYVEQGESVEEKVQVLMVNRPWQGESFVSFDYDGEGEIFFARDGELLP